MSTVVIALLVVAVFVIGQLLLLRPNASETRLMSLRAEARKAGLSVRLLPAPEWYKGERPAGGLLACYSLMLDDSSKAFRYFRAERQADGSWQVRSGDPDALAGVPMPAEVSALIAIEAQVNALSLWWTESLRAESLPVLLQFLRDLQGKAR